MAGLKKAYVVDIPRKNKNAAGKHISSDKEHDVYIYIIRQQHQ